jgi:response regulator RpfG family c-di-GMP phosphodiesterase
MNRKVLFVDDDEEILALYQMNLSDRFQIDTALGAEQGMVALKEQGPYAVILADMKMPGMTGIEFLTYARQEVPNTVRLILTGNSDETTAIEAINRGYIYQFLTKPCSMDVLARALEAAINQYRLVTAERELLENTLSGSIKVLTEILSMVEPQAFGYGQKLQEYMNRLAKHLRVEHPWELEAAAMVSQIGYVTIPAEVIQKLRNGKRLEGPEKDMVARVPITGSELLANIPRLETVSQIVLYQNKHFDGSGFPVDGCLGEQIPMGARMLKVLSDLIQLEERGVPKAQALEQMRQRVGVYDARVLEAAFICFQVQVDENFRTQRQTWPVKVKDLRIGQTLISDVRTKNGMLVIGSGNRISQMLLGRLRNFARIHGIEEPLYVEERGGTTEGALA